MKKSRIDLGHLGCLPALLLVAIVAGALFGGYAFAQDVSWNPVDWGSNPVLAALALAGAVQMLRLKWPTIDGPFKVAGVSAGVGAVGGGALDYLNLLSVAPYTDLATPLGGIAYGLSLALFNATGIAVWNYLTGKVRPVNVTVTDGLVPLAFAGAQERPGSSVADFILGLVKNAVGAAQLPAALVAVAPLLAQFAQSEAILTDDLRSTLQGKVLGVLRQAGLVGVDL